MGMKFPEEKKIKITERAGEYIHRIDILIRRNVQLSFKQRQAKILST